MVCIFKKPDVMDGSVKHLTEVTSLYSLENPNDLSLVSVSFHTFRKSKRLAREFQLKTSIYCCNCAEKEDWVVRGAW